MRSHRPLAISAKQAGPASPSLGGFTLLEMLIVMGIAAIIFSIGLPVSWNFYLDYQLIYEQRTLNSLLGYARNLSMVNANEKPHGLYIGATDFTVFEGNGYASRDTAADKNFSRSSAITMTGPSEQVFAQLSGQTSSSTFSISNGRSTFFTYVNSEGRIEW